MKHLTLGLAAALTAAAFTGCTGDKSKTTGKTHKTGSSSSSSDDDDDSSPAKTGADSGGEATPNTPEALKAIFTRILKARKDGDLATAAKLSQGLFPDANSLSAAFRDGPEADAVKAKLVQMYSIRPPDSKTKLWANLFRAHANQTEVQVHGATTEEIAKNAKGSIVWKEFPGGAVRAAKKVLKPGMTFYEVELVVPGEQMGMKYHLFFHDGKRFVMLGKVWRGLH